MTARYFCRFYPAHTARRRPAVSLLLACLYAMFIRSVYTLLLCCGLDPMICKGSERLKGWQCLYVVCTSCLHCTRGYPPCIFKIAGGEIVSTHSQIFLKN